jgi:flagellar hook protein FlgE
MSIMNTSVSGMQANTNWLSTISQNVANANTAGYKTAETEFSTLVNQASNASETMTGVASGVRYLNSLQGAVVGTSSATDLAIQGDGYFIVSDRAGSLYLTRNGSFVPDAAGNMVNASGYYLMGYDAQDSTSAASVNSMSGLKKVNVQSSGQTAVATTSGTFTANVSSTETAVAAGVLPSTNAAGATYTSMSTLTAYDNLGGSNNLNIYYTKTAANTWEVAVYDSAKAASGGGFPYSSGPLVTQTLNFDPTNGSLTSGTPLSVAVPNGQTMSLDLSGMTQLAAKYSVSEASTNGNAPASVSSMTIGADGALSFQFTNNAVRNAYRIPLADVASPNQMTPVYGGAFQLNAASGAVQLKTAGEAGVGAISASSLENSTVDLATELTDMIQAQSAYQANSKVFQTGANILDILNGLKS